MKKLHIVILGAGIAGVSAAEAATKENPQAQVSLLSSETDYPCYRLRVGDLLLDPDVEERLLLHPASWYKENGIDLFLNAEASSIDREKKEVLLTDGRRLSYDRLIYTCGSQSFVPYLEGADLNNSFTLWSLDSARRLTRAIGVRPIKEICVIGGGLLGLEAAWQLHLRGVKVHILELAPLLLARQLDQESSTLLEEYIKSLGIDVVCSADSEELVVDPESGKMKHIRLKDGREIPGEAVLFSVGVRANTGLGEKCGLEIGRRLKVDSQMRSSDPDIYSAGDVCEVDDGYWFGLWTISRSQGQVAGTNAAGGKASFEKVYPPYIVNTMKTRIVSQGELPAEEGDGVRFEIDVDRENYSYKKKIFRGDQLIGFILIGEAAKEMVALQKELA